jgi:hypothetical protein
MDLSGRELDELKLIALGRIPRCARCPRYAALVADLDTPDTSGGRLPAVPLYCSYQICAPLAARFERIASSEPARPSALPLAG